MLGWKVAADDRMTVNLSRDLIALLKPHAERRGIPVRTLARELLFAAADDDMIDAILDDR